MGGVDARDTHRSRFFNLLSSFQKTCTNHKFHLLNSKGSILIEFAVCMPVLIILLYYINDLSKLKRYYDQTEFAAQQMANILQNISQKRTDKKITVNDLKYAVTLASQTIYPGTTMFHNGICYGLCHRPEFFITYVKGETDGIASCKWVCHLPSGDKTSPETLKVDKEYKATKGSSLNFLSNVPPFSIHPLLKINSEKEKNYR